MEPFNPPLVAGVVVLITLLSMKVIEAFDEDAFDWADVLQFAGTAYVGGIILFLMVHGFFKSVTYLCSFINVG